MALRNIIQEPSDRLRKTCRPVEKISQRILTLIDDMAETMHAADGVGLAAPQVGVLRRVCVIDVGEGVFEMINPVITAKEGFQKGEEGCLSCGSRRGVVVRPQRVTVEYTDRNGEPVTLEGEDLLARAICHEVAHLDGQLFLDIMEYELAEDEDYEEEEEANEQK